VVGDARTLRLGRRFWAVLLTSHLVNDPEGARGSHVQPLGSTSLLGTDASASGMLAPRLYAIRVADRKRHGDDHGLRRQGGNHQTGRQRRAERRRGGNEAELGTSITALSRLGVVVETTASCTPSTLGRGRSASVVGPSIPRRAAKRGLSSDAGSAGGRSTALRTFGGVNALRLRSKRRVTAGAAGGLTVWA
jgi:hypothetical protein